MALLPLIIIILFRIISPVLYVLVKITISRENPQSALTIIIPGVKGHLEDFKQFESMQEYE